MTPRCPECRRELEYDFGDECVCGWTAPELDGPEPNPLSATSTLSQVAYWYAYHCTVGPQEVSL